MKNAEVLFLEHSLDRLCRALLAIARKWTVAQGQLVSGDELLQRTRRERTAHFKKVFAA
jgi:hypothetical protein